MQFGDTAFGQVPFAAGDPRQPAVSLLAALLDAPSAERTYLVELEPYRLVDDTIVPHRLSDLGYTSQGGDSVAHQYFEAVVVQPLRYERDMVQSGIGGMVRSSGELILNNADGSLDPLLTDFAADGRRVTVRLGQRDWSYDDFGVQFRGVIASLVPDETQIRIRIQDSAFRLESPIQPVTYGGAGGADGGEDLAGLPRPLCYGWVWNISPPLVDAGALLYQVHDGAMEAVDAVRDRGVALTPADPPDYATVQDLLNATTGIGGAIEPGEYATSLAAGFFRLGGAPAGQITCDARGAAAPFVESTSDIIVRILEDQAGWASDDINYAAFVRLNQDAPALVGIWTGTQPRSLGEVIGELIEGISGFAGFDRRDRFSAGLLLAPTGAPVMRFTTENIETLEREPLPGRLSPPSWRRRVAWRRNYTVQNDLAGSVPDAVRSFAVQARRWAVQEDATVQDAHPFAQEVDTLGLYAQEADAEIEAQRLQALFGVSGRALYRLVTPLLFRAEFGDMVQVTWPRFGLSTGAFGRVVGVFEDAERYRAELRVFV